MKKLFLLISSIFLFSLSRSFSQAMLVEDIHASGGSSPSDFAIYGGKLYFSAHDGISGSELWVHDGITTSLVQNIYPGLLGSSPNSLTVYDGKLYFAADNETSGAELMVYDGTSVSLVQDIYPGTFFDWPFGITPHSSYPNHLTVYDGKLYFVADDGISGEELWVYDGTTASLVQDIYLGGVASSTKELTVYNGKLYFQANDGISGSELWVYDGTTASLVQDINLYSSFSNPSYLTVYDGKLYFQATNGISGRELWVYDGTTASLVQDIRSGSSSSSPGYLTVYDGKLYFQANDGISGTELWVYDGTTASLVQNIRSGSSSSYPSYLTVYDGKLYFKASDGTVGYELYEYDGTTVTLSADIQPGGSSSHSNPYDLFEYNDKLFFQADDGTHGEELWSYPHPIPCTCSATNPIPTSAGTYTSACTAIDGDWTHYCDDDNNLLLSLKIGTSGAVVADNEVSLEITSPTTSYFAQDCGTSPPCFIDLPNGAVTFNRKWDVSPTTQPTSGNVGVKTYFTQAEYDAVNTELANQSQTQLTGMEEMWFYKVTNAALGQFPTIPIITANDVLTLGNHATTPDTNQWVLSTKSAGSEFIAEFEVSSFSGGGGGGAGGGAQPLPVELVYFHAYAHGDIVKLQWATATETNNLGFEIQKSRDGLEWEKIAFIEGKGNTTTLSAYDFIDRIPYTGENYYRLKQIDLDGKFEYLPIQVVNLESGENATVSVYPNPAKDFLNITNIQGQATIHDISGKLLKTFQLTEDGINAIDIKDLQNGVYHLVLLRNTGERISKKFFK